jgi:hypothetical protein
MKTRTAGEMPKPPSQNYASPDVLALFFAIFSRRDGGEVD